MIRILDRYLFGELSKPFLVGIGAFIVIMLSNTLYLYVEWIVGRGLSAATVGKILLLALPAIIVITLPVGFLFSTLLALSRLGKDSEIIALRASGVSLMRIVGPVLVLSLMVSYGAFMLNETVVPWANSETVKIQRDILKKQPLPLIKPGIFFPGTDNRYFYVDQVSRDQMTGILIFDLTSQKVPYPQVITAKEAVWDKTKFVLKDGMVHKYGANGFLQYESQFKSLDLHMNLEPDQVYAGPKQVVEMSSAEALKQIQEEKRQGIDVRGKMVDYHLKFSLPLATFFSALIAAPLGIRFSRFGNFFGVAAAIALIFIWYVLYSAGRGMGIAGSLSPFLAGWIHDLVFGVVGAGFLVWMGRK